MLDQPKAQAVADAVTASFSKDTPSPTPEQVEAVMRQFAPITQETERAIELLLRVAGTSLIQTRIGSWLEANDVVSGTGPEVERRIQFLMMDTCTCVLDHLPVAIAHATKEVDPRVRALLEHEYLKKIRISCNSFMMCFCMQTLKKTSYFLSIHFSCAIQLFINFFRYISYQS